MKELYDAKNELNQYLILYYNIDYYKKHYKNQVIEYFKDTKNILIQATIQSEIYENHEEAIKLLKMNEYDSYALTYLGLIYDICYGNYNLGEDYFEKAIIFNNSYSYTHLACLNETDNNIEKAIELYNKAIELDDNNDIAYTYLGELLLNKKDDSKKGIEYLKKAIQINNKNSAGLQILGEYFYKNDDILLSIDYLTRSVEIDDNNESINILKQIDKVYIEMYKLQKNIVNLFENLRYEITAIPTYVENQLLNEENKKLKKLLNIKEENILDFISS